MICISYKGIARQISELDIYLLVLIPTAFLALSSIDCCAIRRSVSQIVKIGGGRLTSFSLELPLTESPIFWVPVLSL